MTERISFLRDGHPGMEVVLRRGVAPGPGDGEDVPDFRHAALHFRDCNEQKE